MMATEEQDVSDWDQADSASAKLLSDVGIGGAGLGRKGSIAAKSSQARKGSAQNISMCGLLSLEFYRPYFDVNTDQVKARLLQAAVPMRQTTPFLDEADVEEPGGRRAPDLYGPVWVSATLIFFLSVVSNARRAVGTSELDEVSTSEFDEVSTSVYSVAAYLTIGSLGLWAFFRAHGVPLSPAESLSVYGYSLTSFLAAAPLCMVAWPLRWLGFGTASLISAMFVLRSAWPRLHEHTPEKSTAVLLAAVAAYHFLWFLLLVAV